MDLIRKNTQTLFKYLKLILIALSLSSCTLPIPNLEICTIPFSIDNGATCAETNTDNHRDLSPAELIQWLEPGETKAPALCMSADNYTDLKTFIQAACKVIGKKCTKSIKDTLKQLMEYINEENNRMDQNQTWWMETNEIFI